MLENIFDSHCHYDDRKFDENRDEVLSNLKSKGVVGIIHAGTSLESCEFGINQAKKYDFAYTSIGIHPSDVNTLGDNLQGDKYIEIMREMAKYEKVVAVGEIGLDYYWTKDNKELQKQVFEKQLILAKDLDLPVIIHSREATKDCLDMLKKYKPRGVVHCYSSSKETAKELLNLGLHISFTGVLTFPNAKKAVEALEIIPLEKLLLETDAPYMAPVPNRGKICTSDMIALLAVKIGELKGEDPQKIINICTENTKKLFNI